jgi:inorganic pyrophosphatase
MLPTLIIQEAPGTRNVDWKARKACHERLDPCPQPPYNGRVTFPLEAPMASEYTDAGEYTVDVLVEIPRGSRNKYEFDRQRGVIRLDRVLYSSVHYPTDYGFVPRTLSPDGDELDVLVMVEEPTFPGCLVVARPIGVLVMHDEKGPDSKVLAVPLGDPRFAAVRTLEDIPGHWLREIENFFQTYKRLQDVETELEGWSDRDAAIRMIEESKERYIELQV